MLAQVMIFAIIELKFFHCRSDIIKALD